MPHLHMHIHTSDTPMLCDVGVSIHTVQHMALYLQINTEQPMLQAHYQTEQCPLPPCMWDMSIVTIWLPLVAVFDLCVYLVVSHQT